MEKENKNPNELNRITRESLQIAFIQLMRDKDFDKISITELVKKAGVSRQAFYRNYNSKEEIVYEIGQVLMNSIQKALDDRRYHNNWQQAFVDLFAFLNQQKDILPFIYRAGIIDQLFPSTTSMISSYLHDESVESYYLAVSLVGGIKDVATSWFIRGRKESSKEMGQICYSIFRDKVERLSQNTKDVEE